MTSADIEAVRARADIVDVIGEFVPLRKDGSIYKGHYPFHDDRERSLAVMPHMGVYRCFACGSAGSVFEFVALRRGCDFDEAVRSVAARCGVAVPAVPDADGVVRINVRDLSAIE